MDKEVVKNRQLLDAAAKCKPRRRKRADDPIQTGRSRRRGWTVSGALEEIANQEGKPVKRDGRRR